MGSTVAVEAAQAQVLVGRQPIVDRSGAVTGFELLYRSGEPGTATSDSEQMTVAVVHGSLTIGLQQLVGDRLVWCNADRGLLTGATPLVLPPDRTVVEVLENVEIDEDVVAGCRDLVRRGYALALDDFRWRPGAERLLELATTVKIDVLDTPREEVLELLARCRPFGVTMLAEKVETLEDVAWARACGFDLFQGYAIERPSTVSGNVLGHSALSQLRLMTVVVDEPDLAELEAVLRREPGLVVQLLQLASAGAGNGLRRPVRTVREALVLLGEIRVRQWVTVALLSEGATPAGGPDGMAVALVRARMCELLAQQRALDRPEVAFTVGLLSYLDQLLGVEASVLADELHLDEELMSAAFGRTNAYGALVDEVESYQRQVAVTSLADVAPTDLDAVAASAFGWALPQLSALDRR